MVLDVFLLLKWQPITMKEEVEILVTVLLGFLFFRFLKFDLIRYGIFNKVFLQNMRKTLNFLILL